MEVDLWTRGSFVPEETGIGTGVVIVSRIAHRHRVLWNQFPYLPSRHPRHRLGDLFRPRLPDPALRPGSLTV